MLALALETVTRGGSVALGSENGFLSRSGDPARTHGERLPAELFDLVAAGGQSLDAVDRLVIVAGPGSFTGLRVGMATIQGIATGADLPVFPVPTLDAVREAGGGASDPHTRFLLTCLDGQRGEVFATLHRRTGRDAWVQVMEPVVDRPGHLAEAALRAAGGAPVEVCGVGIGAYRDVWATLGGAVVTPSMPLAEAAARLALRGAVLPVAPHALRPIYIRRPDAEIARARHRAARLSGDDDFRVEEAGPDDLTAVEAVQRRAFDRPWSDGALWSELSSNAVSRLFVLRSPADEVVGYCACWMVADELHVNSIAIDEPWRRRGLGTRLLLAVCRAARREGAKQATLEVRESNRAARALYEHLGFRVEGVRRNYYDTPREDAVILWHRALGAIG